MSAVYFNPVRVVPSFEELNVFETCLSSEFYSAAILKSREWFWPIMSDKGMQGKTCLAGYENLSFMKSGGWDAFKEMVDENEGKECGAFMNRWPPSYLPEAWTVSHCQKCLFCVLWYRVTLYSRHLLACIMCPVQC